MRNRHRLVAVSLSLGLALSLGGCGFLGGESGYLRDRSMDYKSAEETLGYQVDANAMPATLARISSVRPIAQVVDSPESFRPQSLDDVPRPQVIETVDADGRLQVFRGYQARWLWLETDPASAYVWLSQYFTSNDFNFKAGATVGQFFETNWRKGHMGRSAKAGFWSRSVSSLKSIGQDTKPFERYRVWLTPTSTVGLRGTRVIVLRHVGFAESLSGLPKPWPEALPVKASEPVTLADHKGLLDYPDAQWWSPLVELLSGQLTEAAALASKAQVTEGLVVQVRKDGNGLPVLTIDQPFARSWDVIGAALLRAKRTSAELIDVEDLDRSLAVYYIKWLGSEQSASPKTQYQLHVAKGEQGVLVSLQVDDENIAPKEESERVLLFVKSQLDALRGG